MNDEDLLTAKLLIVDDEIANIRLLEHLLQDAGYDNLMSLNDPRQVFLSLSEFQPDLILLDLMMPHLSGFQVMEMIKPLLAPGSYLPILVLTANVTKEAKIKALTAGANDFLGKPFDVVEVLLRIRNLLQTRFLHLQLQDQNQALEERVLERTRELQQSQVEVLERLAQAAEYRDDDTGHHTHRVGVSSALLAAALGFPPVEVSLIRSAAPLHDVGKIGIPDSLLLKPGPLLPEEFDRMKLHTTMGAALLSQGRSDHVKMAETIALTHHERWDGSGYPSGLRDEDIPAVGRIVALADVFDALTHKRPYKRAWTQQEALSEINAQSGRQFDPRLAEAFLRLPHDQFETDSECPGKASSEQDD